LVKGEQLYGHLAHHTGFKKAQLKIYSIRGVPATLYQETWMNKNHDY
jgi:hypothetical protein